MFNLCRLPLMLRRLGALCALLILLLVLLAPQRSQAANLSLDGNLIGSCGTGTASAGAVTLANKCGVITSEALVTAKGSDYTLTITNTVAAAADIAWCSVENGTNTGGAPQLMRCTAGAGTIVVVVKNYPFGIGTNITDGSVFNGTIKVKYFLAKP